MNYPDSVKLNGEFYLQVQNRLDLPDVVFSPAEIHGVATGLVCCGEDESTLVNWAPILTRELKDDTSRSLVEDILSGLVALTQHALQNTDFTFQIFVTLFCCSFALETFCKRRFAVKFSFLDFLKKSFSDQGALQLHH